jgi:uncharacterized protein YecE (DUF72 family)
MPVHLGTSGWHYEDWCRCFYPKGVAKRRWLEHYAARFQTVESNSAFYRLPKPDTFEQWAKQTPEDFVMAVKMSRFLTHVRRLGNPEEPVKRFLDHVRHLGHKLGPVLLQLPPNLHRDLDRLDAALGQFPADVKVAVEFRHETWFEDDTRRTLERHGAALCLADRESRPASPIWRSVEWTYLRFHVGNASPHPCYGRSSLNTWARRLAQEWGSQVDIYVYFNNDTRGCALRDARMFHHAATRAGLNPTRIPQADEVRVL